MAQFTTAQVHILEVTLEEDSDISINRLVQTLKKALPNISGAYPEKVEKFRDAWVERQANIAMPEAEVHIQVDGIPELVLGNMVDLPDVVAGDPFPMPTKLNMEMDINETKLADYEDSLREQLEVIEAGRNGYQAWLRAIRLLR